MISNSCRLRDFIDATREKDLQEVIYLADREATEAERLYYRADVDDARRAACGRRYARRLKHLITFMRYGLRPSEVSREDIELFAGVRAHLAAPLAAPEHSGLGS
jgi:hypothetical protein